MTGAPIVVIGAGAAGLAASLSLRAAGHAVHMIAGGAGASALSSGAVDLAAWEDADGAGAIDEGSARLLDSLGLHRVPDGGVLLATTSGIVRPARGADRALLNLRGLPPGNVLVPRSDHHGWDAVTLARSWTDSAVARARRLTFVPVATTLTRFREERPLGDADLAARHDDERRLGWLAERLREAVARAGSCVAAIVPPWLGIEAPRAKALSARAGFPCGEAASALASSPGRRFERARDRALAQAGIEWTRGWVKKVAPPPRPSPSGGGGWNVELEGGEMVEASAIILAAGGLVGGGLVYDPVCSFRAAFESPAVIGASARPLERPSSPFGVPPESIAWPFVSAPQMDRVGVLVDGSFRARHAPEGLFACGDLVADRPRTWLEAWTAGCRAAAQCATMGPLPTSLSRSSS